MRGAVQRKRVLKGIRRSFDPDSVTCDEENQQGRSKGIGEQIPNVGKTDCTFRDEITLIPIILIKELRPWGLALRELFFLTCIVTCWTPDENLSRTIFTTGTRETHQLPPLTSSARPLSLLPSNMEDYLCPRM
jgi:hypothetical protein